jgi:transposase
MGRYYSLDLRVRVAAFVDAGHSCRAAARHFGVSDSFAIKLVRRQAQSGSPCSGAAGAPARAPQAGALRGVSDPYRGSQSAITMPELAAQLLEEHGVIATSATLSRLLCRHGFTYTKSADGGGVRTRRYS